MDLFFVNSIIILYTGIDVNFLPEIFAMVLDQLFHSHEFVVEKMRGNVVLLIVFDIITTIKPQYRGFV